MTVKINLSNISKKITDKINKSVKFSVDRELAEKTADQIRTRTRLGFGVDENGRQERLKPLAESYREQRKGNIAFFTNQFGVKIPFVPKTKPKLSSLTTPSKSNLTNTSQMLDSIKGKAKNGVMFISITGLRRDGFTNKEIADFVEDQGRTFFNLTNAEKNQLAREIKNRILKNLN